jgi:hypothetical protein
MAKTPTYYKVGSDFFTGVNQKVSDASVLSGLSGGKIPFSTVQGGLEGQFTDPQFFDKIRKGEPSVLSSAAGRNAFDKNVQPTITSANEAVKKAGENQLQTSKVTSSKEPEIPGELLNEGMTEMEKVNSQILKNLDKQIEDTKNMFSSLTLAQHANAQSQINTLTRQWNERRNMMQDNLSRGLRGVENSLIRSGVARYSPISAEDLLSVREKEGLAEISNYDAEYNGKVADINAAMEANMLTTAANLTKELNGIQEKSLAAMKEIAAETDKRNKEIRDRQIQSSRDSAIAGLIEQGITDPTQILNYLNYNDNGKLVGDFTAKEVGDAVASLMKSKTYPGGIIGEYEFYKEQEEKMGRNPVDFNTYQNMDANRKISIAKAGIAGTGLNDKDRAIFNSLVDKQNKSPLVAALDRSIVLKNTIQQVKNDPSNGALQLNLAYSYVQALDTYQSAVREGELSLVNSIDSKVGQLKNNVEKIQNGQIVRPEVAKQIAEAAEKILTTIEEGAKRTRAKFDAQAKANGDAVYEAWSGFSKNIDAANKGMDLESIKNTEAQAETKLTTYYAENPDKQAGIKNAIEVYKQSHGGIEPTATQLLQVFPEINQ